MAFGPVIDVPLLSAMFVATLYNRRKIARTIVKAKLPCWLLCPLSAMLLLIIEEHINCMPAWCLHVVVPPTIWILLGIVILFLLLIKLLRIRNVVIQTLLFSAFGIFMELGGGPISPFVKSLAAERPVFLTLMAVWIGISYAFVIVIPLLVLKERPLLKTNRNGTVDA